VTWSPLRSFLRNDLLASSIVPPRLRLAALRRTGLDLGRVRVMGHCFFGAGPVTIGDGCFVNIRCLFDSSAPIRLGRNVYLAMGVQLVTSSHELGGPERRAAAVTAGPIEIGDGAWLGAGAMVLPGCTVGAGAVVAAGALVTRDLAPNAVYAGVPARWVRDLD
jgi:maltose O-acetyltransferase